MIEALLIVIILLLVFPAVVYYGIAAIWYLLLLLIAVAVIVALFVGVPANPKLLFLVVPLAAYILIFISAQTPQKTNNENSQTRLPNNRQSEDAATRLTGELYERRKRSQFAVLICLALIAGLAAAFVWLGDVGQKSTASLGKTIPFPQQLLNKTEKAE